MKLKKVLSVALVAVMTMSMAACGGSNNAADNGGATNGAASDNSAEATNDAAATESSDAAASTDGSLSYADIKLGEDYTDLTATISLFNHRTDLESDDYNGTTWKEYLAAFNEMYPNITVELTTDTNYADDALMHLQSGDYETVMMIPAVDKADLSNYFISYGDLDTMKTQINYATTWEYGGQVYGVPSTATTQGIVYNKKVFEEAGVTELPKTPEEFIDALQKIKDNTDAIPLYTNYAAGWTMGAWDAYIGNNATGDNTYMNQKLVHTKDPFQNYGDDTHAYAVYKILYDAVADGLIEDDFATTDWEGCKGMINNGEIGCMVLGSWAYPQMEAAGENGCILHYTENECELRDGDLVLIDAGCEYQGYAGDITRTFPVNGKFTTAQREIYDIVLESLETALTLFRPGTSIQEVTGEVVRIMITGLVKLGILKGDVDTLITENAHRPYFMHGLSHWLGLDVHDVGAYGPERSRVLEPGMVLTVEPGLYIAPDADVPEQYRGIGIRIEDDIVITETGNENLTATVVKKADDIEALMAAARV
mgnify:CR=1 FL=1